jgi:hypothetical protein
MSPPATGVDAFNRMARALRDYLSSGGAYEADIAFLIFSLLGLVLFWLVFMKIFSSDGKKISKKDLEFFGQVVFQKGLESFDRDLLYELAETYNVMPVYKILLDEKVFLKVLKKIDDEIAKNENLSSNHTKKEYLEKVRSRLFVES